MKELYYPMTYLEKKKKKAQAINLGFRHLKESMFSSHTKNQQFLSILWWKTHYNCANSSLVSNSSNL